MLSTVHTVCYSSGMRRVVIKPGQKFNSLTVIKEIERREYMRQVLCRCNCGKEIIVRVYDLGRNRSCGCEKKNNLRHGMSGTPEYAAWKSIKTRCYDPNFIEYQHYGGRGIKVCDEWKDDFRAFYNHIGPRPGSGYSVDRIDNDGDYEPGNVKWSTKSEQHRNTRQNLIVTYRGESRPLVEWVEELGLNYSAVQQRLVKLGWPAERAFSTPVRKKRTAHR